MEQTNPLVDSQTDATLLNVVTVTRFLHEYLESQQYLHEPINVNSQSAISLMLQCTDHALMHEVSRLEQDEVEEREQELAVQKKRRFDILQASVDTTIAAQKANEQPDRKALNSQSAVSSDADTAKTSPNSKTETVDKNAKADKSAKAEAQNSLGSPG